MDIPTILLVVIGAATGFIFGGLLTGLGQKPKPGRTKTRRKALLRIWREPDKEHLVIEMGGDQFTNSIQLNARQRSQLGQMILELNEWLDAGSASEQRASGLRIPQDLSSELTPIDKPKPRIMMNPVNVLSNAFKADVPRSQLPTESIVTQIDAILQEKLKYSPLQDQAIRLLEWPEIGMVVMVGLEKYETVEEVPDPMIQNLIRSAVKEWEQRGSEES